MTELKRFLVVFTQKGKKFAEIWFAITPPGAIFRCRKHHTSISGEMKATSIYNPNHEDIVREYLKKHNKK